MKATPDSRGYLWEGYCKNCSLPIMTTPYASDGPWHSATGEAECYKESRECFTHEPDEV